MTRGFIPRAQLTLVAEASWSSDILGDDSTDIVRSDNNNPLDDSPKYIVERLDSIGRNKLRLWRASNGSTESLVEGPEKPPVNKLFAELTVIRHFDESITND